MSLTGLFPNLTSTKYRVTSEKTPRYNCVAWACGDDQQWWQPDDQYHWPTATGDDEDYSPAVLVGMLESMGFEKCQTASPEPGYEKVAIYAKDGEYTHIARQLDSGWWTSKIGPEEDIEHETLGGLEGKSYGEVIATMRRKINGQEQRERTQHEANQPSPANDAAGAPESDGSQATGE